MGGHGRGRVAAVEGVASDAKMARRKSVSSREGQVPPAKGVVTAKAGRSRMEGVAA